MRPDILIIDEILGVGDFAFQNKCFARMQALKKGGTTFVLVSHSHTQVVQLCETALWMHEGRMRGYGTCREVVDDYLRYLDSIETERVTKSPGDSEASESVRSKESIEILYGPVFHEKSRIESVFVQLLQDGIPTNVIEPHTAATIRYSFTLPYPVENLNVTLNFHREDGLLVSVISTLRGDLLSGVRVGQVVAEVAVADMHFVPGSYVVTMPVHEGHGYLFRGVVLRFHISNTEGMYWGITELPYTYKVLATDTDRLDCHES